MKKIQIEKTFFREKISNQNIKIRGPLRLIWRALFWLLFLSLIAFSIWMINFSNTKYGLNIFIYNLKDFFSPHKYSSIYKNQNLFLLSISFLWQSIKLIFLGTTIGFLIASFTAYFSNLKMNSKYIAIPIKIFIIALRIFPELFFIYLFTQSADKNLAINLIFSWFTWLWLHEYFSQAIENSNFTIFYHLQRIKTSRFKAFLLEIWPQIKIKVINYIFYAFESNLRWSTILSKLSFLGIGLLVAPAQNSTKNYFNQLLTPLMVLIVFIFLLEISNIAINSLFKSRTIKEINIKKYEKVKIIKRLLIALFFIASITIITFAVISLKDNKIYFNQAKQYFSDFFSPNLSSISFAWNENGIIYMVIEIAALVFLTLTIIHLITRVKMFLMTKQLVTNYTSIFFRFSNSFVRAIPTLSLFIIISALYNSSSAAFVLAFAIHGASTLSRSIESSIRKLPISVFNQLKKQGYNIFKIYFNYVLPSIKLDYITLLSFEIEKTTRNFITYGLYSSSALGLASTENRIKGTSDIAIYLWISFVIIALINLASYLIRAKISNNFKLFHLLSRHRNNQY